MLSGLTLKEKMLDAASSRVISLLLRAFVDDYSLECTSAAPHSSQYGMARMPQPRVAGVRMDGTPGLGERTREPR